MRHAAILVCTVVAGCGVNVGNSDRAIINGTVDDGPEHDAIVALTDANGDAFCTGTYVGNQTVVTAAHCFNDVVPTWVYVGVDAVEDNESCLAGYDDICDWFFSVEDHLIHPGWTIGRYEDGNDIALIKIDIDPPGVSPLPFLATSERTEFVEHDRGASIAFVGFGVTDGAAQTGAGLRRSAPGTLEAFGPESVEFAGETITLREDQVFVRQPNAGTCQGDSGGPLLIKRDGVEYLGAVTSYGDDGCTGYDVSVTVDVHEQFIREFYGDGDIPGEYDPGDGGNGGNGDGGGNGEGSGDGGGGGCSAGSPASSSFACLCLVCLVFGAARRRSRVTGVSCCREPRGRVMHHPK